MEFLVLNWQRLVDLTLDLSLMVKESGYRPDSIIAILRGGYIVGKLVSDFLGIDDLVVLGLVSYGTKIGQGEEPVVTYPIIRDLRGGKSVLVVDDVADTGKTLATARDLTRFYGAREVRVATLYVKPGRGSSLITTLASRISGFYSHGRLVRSLGTRPRAQTLNP